MSLGVKALGVEVLGVEGGSASRAGQFMRASVRVCMCLCACVCLCGAWKHALRGERRNRDRDVRKGRNGRDGGKGTVTNTLQTLGWGIYEEVRM